MTNFSLCQCSALTYNVHHSLSSPNQMDLRNIPEEVVKETLEYKCLQSQFSLLYNESLGVKTQLDEARALLLTAKNAHLRQIEHMEVNFIYQS